MGSGPVVPLIEARDKLVGLEVIVHVGNYTFGESRRETRCLGGGCDNGNIRVSGMDGIVNLRES